MLQIKTVRILIFILALDPCLTNVHAAEERSGRSLPVCRLTVRFDLTNSLVRGDVSITAPEGGKTMVSQDR